MKTLVLRFPGSVGVCAAGVAALVGLAGCFDNDPGMKESLLRAQVELGETKQKLQTTEAALANAQAALKSAASAPTPAPVSAAPSTPTAPTKEQLNDGYITAAKDMRAQLKNELTGYSIINCTLYEVSTVAAMPYTSKVAIALRSDKGLQYKVEMPVGADATGSWKFPTTQEILDNIAKNPPKSVATNEQPASATAGNPVAGRGPAPFQPRAQDKPSAPPPVSGIGDGNVDTVTLNWSNSQTRGSGGGSRSGGGTTPVQPPAPAPASGSRPAERAPAPAPARPAAPAPAQPSQPAPAMPADQSVLVTF